MLVAEPELLKLLAAPVEADPPRSLPPVRAQIEVVGRPLVGRAVVGRGELEARRGGALVTPGRGRQHRPENRAGSESPRPLSHTARVHQTRITTSIPVVAARSQ